MKDNQEFNQLYRDVSENMAAAMTDLSKLTVSNTEGQDRLDHITKTLKEMQAGFDAELEFLETNAEWEKFTMAFFGETNAGKSTIIESLRILFNESSRQQLIEENQQNVNELAQKLQEHADYAEIALANAFHKHARGVETVRNGCGELKAIIAEESVERLRVAEEAASSRVKRNLVLACLAGVLAGAGGASAILLALGG
ncbi:hypothetical protein L0636_13510 [Halomonas janggokensis]|uniref:Uncharacterized protein n=1 Tax=Vreelandella janggokensis TaxID=370767 RepID=A0ABT4IYI9_9GAMM|nr:hypothetical protein [Halomonas janggokensis]MCZ0928705.1 hypothetical protein [Halomonas janggokensis]MCZ0931440.1 hypothetical protein [Halomonas janggokensis]